jgi:NTP pyrophosphatase (non-canonical NTP hydrolase)
MAYHKREIKKGILGEYSKIQEEFDELHDAIEQEDKILQICELTDLIGAIECFSETKFNLSLNDLIKFSSKTKLAFKENKRS